MNDLPFAFSVSELKALVRDAERYRWLREPDNAEAGHLVSAYGLEDLDNSIDKAICSSEPPVWP